MKNKKSLKKVSIFIETHHKVCENILLFFIFLLNLFLVMSNLMPGLLVINPHDGVKYIESGRLLLTWGLRNLSWGPLVAFIYAPIHLFVGNSPDWFMLEAWMGNFILFGLMWFSFYALARELKQYISKYVFIGLLFSSTVFFPIIENQSDALFVALSALALKFLIRFNDKGGLKNLCMCSLFVGLGILSRVETILLVFPLLVFAFIINRKQHKWHKVLLSALVPVTGVLMLFFIANLINFGHLNLGVGSKSYASFQVNPAFLPGSKNQQAYLRGEAIFGTEEENQGSILRAIIHNPLAAGERALANLLKLPNSFMDFFGKVSAPIILLFSVWGFYVLLKSREKLLTWILIIWPLHALAALIFLPRHIVPQMSYVFFIFSGIGITYFLSHRSEILERVLLLIVSSGLTLYSVLDTKPAFVAGGVLLIVFALTLLLNRKPETDLQRFNLMAGMLLLIGLVMFGNRFSFPSKTVGESPRELAIHQLQEALPVNANVLTSYHTVPIAAKKNSLMLPGDVDTAVELLEYLEDREIEGVFIDSNIPYPSDAVIYMIKEYPDRFELYYQSEDGDIRIYLYTPNIDP
jgi:hypothetical protein